VITGRETGVTAREYTQYLLSWIDKKDLKESWEKEIDKIKRQ